MRCPTVNQSNKKITTPHNNKMKRSSKKKKRRWWSIPSNSFWAALPIQPNHHQQLCKILQMPIANNSNWFNNSNSSSNRRIKPSKLRRTNANNDTTTTWTVSEHQSAYTWEKKFRDTIDRKTEWSDLVLEKHNWERELILICRKKVILIINLKNNFSLFFLSRFFCHC